MIFLAVAVFGLNAMAQDHTKKDMAHTKDSKILHSAVCILYPTQGSKVTGTVKFTQVSGGVKVVADLQGLTKGKHGFHIHEYGDCTAPDGTSAGGHFNPGTMNHGASDGCHAT